jgi:hypothetical protein
METRTLVLMRMARSRRSASRYRSSSGESSSSATTLVAFLTNDLLEVEDGEEVLLVEDGEKLLEV